VRRATPAHGEHGAGPRLSWYFADTRSETTCRGPRCGKRCVIAMSVKSAKWMLFDPPLAVLETRLVEGKPGEWRQAMLVDLARTHFASCVDRDRFSTKART
jgi:hypothetical protein